MKKALYYLILLIFFSAGISLSEIWLSKTWPSQKGVSLVLAEDDEESEEDEEEDEEKDEEEEEGEEGEKETVTTYVKLPDQIVKKLIEMVIYDSDGDGVFDPEDSTPNLHNIFIVTDNNFNGIVDAYENRQ